MTVPETTNANQAAYLPQRGWSAVQGSARPRSLGTEIAARFLLLVAAACFGVVGVGFFTDTSHDQLTRTAELPREWRWNPRGVEVEGMYSTPMTRGVAPGVPTSMWPSQPR